MIRQGDVYWIDLRKPVGSAPGYRRPFVVVQNDAFNASRIRTVVLCALTTNLARADAPGNVLIKKGDAGLSGDSVINITQIATVDKSELTDRAGRVPPSNLQAVIKGINLLLTPSDPFQ
jgi:mRNA interferase MazF